ncbi:hypothetical protein [Aeoliella sp. SH292]|uniref:hypothetical protein n=1 Tax=Aeoliella sp. SH292 TaxID=3454464 RepID=UPI003F987D52
MRTRARMNLLRNLCLIAVCIVGLAGCRPSYQLDIAPAHGTVTLDGKPLSAGSVLLMPAKGRGASAPLARDGTFVLTTYNPGDGAILGKHKVIVLPLQSDSESDELPAGYVDVPGRYRNATTSGIEVEVVSGKDNVFDFQLESK